MDVINSLLNYTDVVSHCRRTLFIILCHFMLYNVFVNISEHAVSDCNLDKMFNCAFMTCTATGMLMNMWSWCSLPILTPHWPRTQFLRC